MAEDEKPGVENPSMQKSLTGWLPPMKLYSFAQVPVVADFTPKSNWLSIDDIAQVTAPSFKYTTYEEYYNSVQQEYVPPQPKQYICSDGECPLCGYFGNADAEVVPANPLIDAIPGLAEKVKCPCGCNDNAPVWNVVIHLNDGAKWSREKIADWLDTLDADLRFKLPETPEITEGIS